MALSLYAGKKRLFDLRLGLSVLLCLFSLSVNANNVEIWNDFKQFIDKNPQYTDAQYGIIYPSHTPPSIQLARQARAYLLLAEAAYENTGAPSGWTRMENIFDGNGFAAALFVKGEQAVLAFRGSEAGVSDWLTDAEGSNNKLPYQYQKAIEVARSYRRHYRDYQLSFTGHSLGGALATIAGMTVNKPALVFDALGMNRVTREKIQTLAKMNQLQFKRRAIARIINYNLRGEFVSDADKQQDADTLGKTAQIGQIFYLSADRFKPWRIFDNPISRHYTTPLKEELNFLAEPAYRDNTQQLKRIGNGINARRARQYRDGTNDTFDVLIWSNKYMVNSIPSLIEDIFK